MLASMPAGRKPHVQSAHECVFAIAMNVSRGLRLVLAGVVAVLTLGGLYALIGLTDRLVAFWQRIEQLPPWLSGAMLVLALALLVCGVWLVWRLLRPPPRRAPRPQPLDRAALEQRMAKLETVQPTLGDELAELDRRRAAGTLHVALFGEISSGKSSLLQALAPDSAPDIDVVGGSTRRVQQAQGRLPDGRLLALADVPGLNERDGDARAALARDEAARAHALVYVADGDLTRSQDQELRALIDSGRPVVLALNKSDRYRDDEREALLAHLRRRYPPPHVLVAPVSAGHVETVQRRHADGRVEQVERRQPAQLDALLDALAKVANLGPAALEPAREQATLARLDTRLDDIETQQRRQQAEASISRYTRRAVLGALAAVAPGTDLLIQGALATALIRELCGIYQLPPRDIDLDSMVAGAGSAARASMAVTLAIAGNALKAFPGAGTLGGGLVHALAYGLIFDALGRAVAGTLAECRALDREATLAAFASELQRPGRERLQRLAALAWDVARDAGTEHDDAR